MQATADAAARLPPRSTVYGYFRAWIAAGVWAHVHDVLYRRSRELEGREESPTAAIIGGPARRHDHVRRDGDSIEVAGVPVRIADLDFAERGTTQGDRANFAFGSRPSVNGPEKCLCP